MPSLSDDRKRNLYSFFAIISAILSLGHFVVIDFSITLAKQVDNADEGHPNIIPDWNGKQNIPFAAILGLFAAIQFCSSLAILLLNKKEGASRTLYYNSLLGLLVTFAIGVSLTILASEYNTFTRPIKKDQTLLPTLMPFYWTIQVDATATFLFSFPMLLFIFYNNLEGYLRQQREANKNVTIDTPQTLNKVVWILSLFLINAFAHIALCINVYQFTGKQDSEDYTLDDLADQYTFYISVEVVVTLIAIIFQIRHLKNQFLKKNQLVLIAAITAVFQFGSFIIIAIKAVQFHLDIWLSKDGNCYFNDCNACALFRWEITGYSILTFLTLLAQIPYFRAISTVIEKDQARDTLITEQNYQS